MNDHVREAVGSLVDGFVTKAVIIAEVVENDGETYLVTFTTDSVTAWDRKGMLSYALDAQWVRQDGDED